MAGLLCGKTVVNLNYHGQQRRPGWRREQGRPAPDLYLERVPPEARATRHRSQRGAGRLRGARHGNPARSITRGQLAWSWLTVELVPTEIIARLYGAVGDAERPALILFSSGSEGLPKGVVLTHRNVLANIKQITDMLNPVADDVVIGCLPLFHAFGLTVTTLLPWSRVCRC
jgi:acyl-[acyl-carrier-protein]-phospholipid O-acyltransferase/long-chain-fatty-acid--[acyl-carrier-protein] ligase